MNDLIAAIDLGTTKVAVAVGKKTTLGVKIVAYAEEASRGIKRGRVENVRLANMALNKALASIESQINAKIKKAFVGIAGQDIKCVSLEPFQVQRKDFSELISSKEINEITRNTYNTIVEDGAKVFYSVPQSFNVDNYMSVSEPVGMEGRNILARYKLFTAKENSKKIIESTLRLSEIEVLDVILEPIASAKSVLTEDEMELGSILVDIGGGTTDVAVISRNVVRYAGIIPFGGNSITNDICAGFNITADKAEFIKVNHGSCFSDYAEPNKKLLLAVMGAGNGKEVSVKVLARIIQARMEEILEAVCYHVEQSGYKDYIRGGMVFTGGGSKIENLTNLANFVTGYEARLGSPNTFTIDPSSCDMCKDAKSSTVAGMLIHAFQKIEEEDLVLTNCFQQTTVSGKSIQATDTEDELVLVPKKAKGKSLKEKITGLFDTENLFNSKSNKV